MKKTTSPPIHPSSCQWLFPIADVAQGHADNFSKNRLGLRRLLPALVFLFMLVSVRTTAQTELWGMTSQGGAGYGALIKINTDGSGFSNYSFGNEGANPYGDLLESGGKLYGMTSSGGSSGAGMLFEYDPSSGGNGAFTVKYNFDNTNGGHPRGNLVESNGKFYGLTALGGINNKGVLFEYDPASGGSGTYTVWHHFDSANGAHPHGSLIVSGGKFYGMTIDGGNNNNGVLFEYDPISSGSGIYTVKHHFTYNAGADPKGNLLESGGKFYGMTSRGGNNHYGVLFEYDPTMGGTGIYTVKHHFAEASGEGPFGSLIAFSGKFYGMTLQGGSKGVGVLFEYDPAISGPGSYTVKHNFEVNNGGLPIGSILVSGGKFYGTTLLGGSNDDGVIFEYDPAGGGGGNYTVKHHFESSNGDGPQGSLIAAGGKFYGMTFEGGNLNGGVVFEYDPAGGGTGEGIYMVKHHFDLTNPIEPRGNLIASGGKFYGMTNRGGNNRLGVIFEYDPAGGGGGSYSSKHHFDIATGGLPYGSLMESGGKFYGMTKHGGSNQEGVLFEYDPAAGGGGAYTVKHHFTHTTGGEPLGSLIASDGKFYGMTYSGGSNNHGVLFEYDPAGSGGGAYNVKHHFVNTKGWYPCESLIASGGKFYGMTSHGGSNDGGVIFEYDPAISGPDAYTVKHHFADASGSTPSGSLIESGGKFYGMTTFYGDHYVGVLFEYDPIGIGGGTYTVKHHFDNPTGSYPSGSLVESGGKFYGMTHGGGSSDFGVIFEFAPAGSGGGTYTVLRHLELADGIMPYGDLIAVTTVNTTTLAESPAFEMQISPNPSSDLMAIEIFSEKALTGNLAIYDLQGRQITELAKEKVFHGQERIVWESAVPAGVYFLRLLTEAGVHSKKFVKQ